MKLARFTFRTILFLSLAIGSVTTACRIAAADDVLDMIKFVDIKPGKYVRGFGASGKRDDDFQQLHKYSTAPVVRNETPTHTVELTNSFSISATEITVGQFRAFVQATGYQTDAEKNGGALGCFPNESNYVDRFHIDPRVTWRFPGFEQTAAHPVVAVSWNDARAFCGWLSSIAADHRYRLPTEAEWEHACRAGTSTWYSWGDNPDDAYWHSNVADGALEHAQPKTTQYQRAVKLGDDQGDGHVFTAPVGSGKPNPWGLFDTHGNVWEWCEDRWQADLYDRYFDGISRQKRSEVVIRDPVVLEKTAQHEYGDWRVIRGGAWTCAPASVRSSIRTYAEAAAATVYTGFRIVREIDPSQK